MVKGPNDRFRHHKRRHSIFGAVAVCLLAVAIIGGPFLWPLPKAQTPQATAVQGAENARPARYVHPGPALPFFLLNTATIVIGADGKPVVVPGGQQSASGGLQGSTGTAATAGTNTGAALAFSHLNITTTWFYVGEPADDSNDYISNAPSAWDGQWQSHYGGVDNPNSRSGYSPAGFTPHENPFYFALPFNDITESGVRKSVAGNCLNKSNGKYSWCKNSWIAIRHNGKIAYAQWEDVGPNNEDDSAYVFGSAKQTNTFGARAGLDVSPAVRDYLGLGDVDHADWALVSAADVPNGPWKNIITTGLGDATVN
ncbi:MAG TPA: hypothetical protein VLI54_04080 [Bacillota bacterium]|nr:hypothetical protein [Bacillota bacterium]